MNPYEVLGVSPNDDEETIKKKYRELVKKYHPDRYVNTPMAETASEKMKEINEAYDMLTNKNTQSNGYSGYGNNSWGGYSTGYGYNNYNYDTSQISFETVRRLITSRRFFEAEYMLNSLPQNAQWYYLMGIIYVNKGWYNKGIEFIKRACSMDPQNQEYQATLNSFSQNNTNYRNVVFTSGNGALGVCTSLCVSWLCFRYCGTCLCCC